MAKKKRKKIVTPAEVNNATSNAKLIEAKNRDKKCEICGKIPNNHMILPLSEIKIPMYIRGVTLVTVVSIFGNVDNKADGKVVEKMVCIKCAEAISSSLFECVKSISSKDDFVDTEDFIKMLEQNTEEARDEKDRVFKGEFV